jgi:hypothetical protein
MNELMNLFGQPTGPKVLIDPYFDCIARTNSCPGLLVKLKNRKPSIIVLQA